MTPGNAPRKSYPDPQVEIETLSARLAEAEDLLLAIRQGEIDALVVQGRGGDQVYTLHSDEEPYRNLVEQMQEGAVVLSPRGEIVYSNARFAALVGQPLETVIGQRFDRFVPPCDRDSVNALLAAGTGRGRSQLARDGAGLISVHLSLTTTGSAGVDRLNLIVTDLSELLEAHDNRDRAERDNQNKDEFLAMLAHELRSPLGAITSAIQVLDLVRIDGEPAARLRAREVISRQVGHLSHLIDDLLDVERVASGKIRLNRRPLDMSEAVRRAVVTFSANPELNRQIDVDVEPVWVDGDPVRLEQVLTNLVTNAVKYTNEGGSIRVTLRGEDNVAVLRIEDTGFGIAPDLLPHIFDMFVQGDRTLDRARGGLGIGLTLVRRLVELHGGTIGASSEGEGYGSIFTVRLTQIASPLKPADDSATVPGGAKPRRVLLIEDSPDAREMLRMMLELAGHVVYAAPDGLHGLELVNVVQPDVAIIDIGLPIMDGYEVAKRIRQEQNGRRILLLALTGYGFADDRERSQEAGFDHHLVKPVDADNLMRMLADESSFSDTRAS